MNKFFMAPVPVWELEGLQHREKAVYAALCTWASWDDKVERGTSRPGLQSIVWRSGYGKTAVCESLKLLEYLGLIKRTKRPIAYGYLPTEYVLLADETSLKNALSVLRTVRSRDSAPDGTGSSDRRSEISRQTDKNTSENTPSNTPGSGTPESGSESAPPHETPPSEGLLSQTPGTYPTPGETREQNEVASLYRDTATLGHFISLWNGILVPLGFKKVVKGSPKREKEFQAMLNEDSRRLDPKWWENAVHLIENCGYLVASAKAGKRWIDVDWVLKEDNLVKILERKYVVTGDAEQDESESVTLVAYKEGIDNE